MIEAYLAYISVAFFWLFIAFMFVMKVKHKVEGTIWYKPLMVLFGYPFIIADWYVNLIISPFFLDLPATKGELVTGRMKRYKLILEGQRNRYIRQYLRYRFAWWLCGLLNQHDKNHC